MITVGPQGLRVETTMAVNPQRLCGSCGFVHSKRALLVTPMGEPGPPGPKPNAPPGQWPNHDP